MPPLAIFFPNTHLPQHQHTTLSSLPPLPPSFQLAAPPISHIFARSSQSIGSQISLALLGNTCALVANPVDASLSLHRNRRKDLLLSCARKHRNTTTPTRSSTCDAVLDCCPHPQRFVLQTEYARLLLFTKSLDDIFGHFIAILKTQHHTVFASLE